MKYSATEFEALYIQCFPPSMRLAMSLLHEEDEARDVVQEVFLKLWESDMRFDNPLAFIIRAVRNACLNRISMMETREKVRRRLSLDSPPDDFDIEAHHEEVMTAVRSLLTPREREIVDKIYAEGLSYRETAENLEVSVAAVNKNIVSALKKLRNHFKTGKS
ncbi:MAG: sigma-70 family RNA polymerase sigma factor [Muribaculaceae bacterium]|mgnify:FL=1|nr:sigma-70 family RNA polymerase sigma factor [Muribaculaceae bacterium]